MLKEKDFIELDYTGRIKETNQVFDTTEESIAKKENVYNPNASYGPKVICLGQKQILPAIDKEIIGKKVNETFGKLVVVGPFRHSFPLVEVCFGPGRKARQDYHQLSGD